MYNNRQLFLQELKLAAKKERAVSKTLDNPYIEVANEVRNNKQVIRQAVFEIIIDQNHELLITDNLISNPKSLTENIDPEYEVAEEIYPENNEDFNGANQNNVENIEPPEENIIVNPNTNADEQVKHVRKRLRNEKNWKRNVKKNKVNHGQAYETKTKKSILARSAKGTCGEKCRIKCPSKINAEQQLNLHDAFWKLGDHSLQRNFIVSNTTEVNPTYRQKREGSNRGKNVAYYFTINNEKVRVCKEYFMKSLDIGDKFIRNSRTKISEVGVLEKEKQGLHGKQPKLSQHLRTDIRNHIKPFPKIESHYLREQTTKEFLDGSLTIAEMYRMYVIQQKERGAEVAKKWLYEEIFNTEFNYSFFIPKKDLCCLCERYKNDPDDDKIKQKYLEHVRQKMLSRDEKNKDILLAKEQADNYVVSCFDLQAVLKVPCGEVSIFYYKRKLNCFNFTVYDTATRDGFCYFWHEGIAKRGVNEIGSCVLMYLKDHCLNKNVVFYSDNCAGQNKNKAMAGLYLYAVSNFDIPSITHKYLIVGHTQNEGDTMHSVIEKQKKRVLKSGSIYVPTQWTSVIKLSKKTGKPYNLKELATSEISDIKKLSDLFSSNCTKNTNNEKVLWSNIKVMRAEKENPNILYYKSDYSEVEFKEIHVGEKLRGRGRPSMLKNLPKAYLEAPNIPQPKMKDLLEMCTTKAIPEVHHSFFHDLKTSSILQPGSESDEEQ